MHNEEEFVLTPTKLAVRCQTRDNSTRGLALKCQKLSTLAQFSAGGAAPLGFLLCAAAHGTDRTQWFVIRKFVIRVDLHSHG